MGDLWKCQQCLHRYDDESEQAIDVVLVNGQKSSVCPTCYHALENSFGLTQASLPFAGDVGVETGREIELPPVYPQEPEKPPPRTGVLFNNGGLFKRDEIDLLERLNRDLVSTGVTEIWDAHEALAFREFVFKLIDVVEAAKLGRDVASLNDLRITRGDTGNRGFTIQWDGLSGGRFTVYEATWLGALRAAHTKALNNGDITT